MQTRNNHATVQKMAQIGILSAMVFALSWVNIQLGESARIHLGNVMCLLSGVLFGPMVGGLASGFGSMLFDFTNPLYISEFWITFLMKFAMGFVAGFLYKHLHERLPTALSTVTPALFGSLTYVLLYASKSVIFQRWVYGNVWEAVWPVVALKVSTSLVNGLIAVVGCTLLAPILRAALDKAGIFKRTRMG